MKNHVVFYHGTFHDENMWDHWIKNPLLDSYTIHTPSVYSETKPIGKHGLNDYIRNARDHLDSIDGKVHLIGWSMGATVAQHVTIGEQSKKGNNKVLSTQLLSPTAPYGSIKGITESLKGLHRAPRWAMKVLNAGMRKNSDEGYIPVKKEFYATLFNRISDDEKEAHYNTLRESSLRAGFQEYFWSLDIAKANKLQGSFDWSRIYVGAEDLLTPPAMAVEVARKRKSYVEIIPGRGHCIPFEINNEKLLERIIKFTQLVDNLEYSE